MDLGIAAASPLEDDIRVYLCHPPLCSITLPVPRKGRPVEHKVEGGEALVKVMVCGGERAVEACSDVRALKSAGGCKDGNFGHSGRYVDNPRGALEIRTLLEIRIYLVRDALDIGSEGRSRQGNFNKLDEKTGCQQIV